jgi:hypothetical protein
MECVYCKKICKNDNSLRNHQRLCKLNPNRQILPSYLNLSKWKERVSMGLAKVSNQHIKAKENGYIVVVSEETKNKISKASKGRQLTNEQKDKLKIAMRKAVLENPESYTASNVSGRTPIIEYNGFKLKGTWELEVAKWLDRNDIKWTNKIKPFEYEWNNSIHLYFPDFFLIELNRYIEVKGFERERDRCKWKVVNNLIIIKKDDLKKIKTNEYKI